MYSYQGMVALQKLELSFEEMKLRIADRHAALAKTMEEMKRTYEENNLKISENHKNVSLLWIFAICVVI